MAGFLSAHAIFLYKGLTEDIKDDYVKLTKELEMKLLTEDRKRFITHQYDVRAQKSAETVSAYARALSDLAKSALSYMTVPAERERNLRDRFIAGLCSSICNQVALWAPDSFQQALTAAERVKTMTVNADTISNAKFEAQFHKLTD